MYSRWFCRFSHFLLVKHLSTSHIEWPFRIYSSWPFLLNLFFGTKGESFLHLFDLFNLLSIIKHHKFSMFFDEIGVFGESGRGIFDNALDKFPVVESFWRLRLTVKFYFRVYTRCYHFYLLSYSTILNTQNFLLFTLLKFSQIESIFLNRLLLK